MSLGDEQIVKAACGRGIAKYGASDTDEQFVRRSLGAATLWRFREQLWSLVLDEIEDGFADSLQIGEHGDQFFGSHRVRPCT
jgi:hypothetical protein